jgi:hypothetical protein
LVLLVKLTAVLKARSGATADISAGLSGRTLCSRWSTYTRRKPAALNSSMAIV